ncbi:MAG: hypothetical protein JRE57_11435 [Deltaproteobacteria bacterium]|nr:hypothetical protein [Deltaproteobacteria bacterium]
MGKSTHQLGIAAVFAVAVCIGWGCAGALTGPFSYRYFTEPPVDDAWGHKIDR